MRLIGELHGADDLVRKLHPPRLIGPPSRALMTRFGEIARDEARTEAPEGISGDLKGSIDFRIDGGAVSEWARIGSNLDYATYVHEGTRPHWPPIDAIAPWALSKGIPPFLVARQISRVGTMPNPFLRRGFERAGKRIDHLMTIMARQIERNFGGG